MTDNPLGLYLHIPFCNKKCAYCDFYSVFPIGDIKESYKSALLREMKKWGGILNGRPIDTIYIGGGTPSVLGEEITEVLEEVYSSFNICENAEITAEANPEDIAFLKPAKAAGVNRLSIGAQSFDDCALKILGRRHTAEDTVNFYKAAGSEGFLNISLDIMLGLPQKAGGIDDAQKMLELCPEHISAYILKREQRTRFYKENTPLPDDDTAASEYLAVCELFEKAGYCHYEISNFAKPGFESRHNLKYWQAREYIGIGPGAHSFFEGERFFYSRDIKEFIENPKTVKDGLGGDAAEKIMLGLRLQKGVDLSLYYSTVPPEIKEKIKAFKAAGLLCENPPFISLTDKGMLLSNSIITELIL